MDCVEVVPLVEVLRKGEGGQGKKGNSNGKARGAAGARAIMSAPKTPFVLRSSGRTVRERLERDEIGELFLRLYWANLIRYIH
jgi:hypothetical protein